MKEFNVTGACIPQYHYMVNLDQRTREIRQLVDSQKYFIINRARQYGKTTTLMQLAKALKDAYLVVSMDFQRLGNSSFETEFAFSKSFARYFVKAFLRNEDIPTDLQRYAKERYEFFQSTELSLFDLFEELSNFCTASPKPIVLMIDEVDSATNNQVFLDFLAQLRSAYLERYMVQTFQSVILAGVYDIKNLKGKLRPDEEHKNNSPWNIATDFEVNMSFSVEEIAGMLKDYELEHHTGMNLMEMSQLLYDYTSGYPFLVSRLCKIIDEELPEAGWTKAGFLEAERKLLQEKNTLFESLSNKLNEYPEMNRMISAILFMGNRLSYNAYQNAIAVGTMFGFLKEEDGAVVISNRIFETWLYNLYLSSEELKRDVMYRSAIMDKNQFVVNGRLNMKLVLEKFVQHFHELYGGCDERFLEEFGRKHFLLYLRPIINGTGNYYIEAQTRDQRRTDVIVDYRGEQYIVEMKIWRGEEYNHRGEQQLVDYLEVYGLKRGYMISFNFNKNKTIGLKEIILGDKMIVEAVL